MNSTTWHYNCTSGSSSIEFTSWMLTSVKSTFLSAQCWPTAKYTLQRPTCPFHLLTTLNPKYSPMINLQSIRLINQIASFWRCTSLLSILISSKLNRIAFLRYTSRFTLFDAFLLNYIWNELEIVLSCTWKVWHIIHRKSARCVCFSFSL